MRGILRKTMKSLLAFCIFAVGLYTGIAAYASGADPIPSLKPEKITSPPDQEKPLQPEAVPAAAAQQPLKDVRKAPAARGTWIRIGKKYKFKRNNGTFIRNEWVRIQKKIYYFDEKEFRSTGWITYQGRRYFFDREGKMRTGWVKAKGKRYFLNPKGIMAFEKWVKSKGRYYYLKADGSMATGWLALHKRKYYLNADGSRAAGWKRIDGSDYYFNSRNGVMQSRKWVTYKGKAYYLKSNGKMAKGWLTLGKKKYYLDSQGARVAGENYINGKWYYFSKKGVYDPKKKISTKVDPNKPMIALTFDDGPSAHTGRLLECLKNNRAKATFFVVGNSVSRYPEALKKADSMGCEIGNHTYSHPSLTGLSADGIRAQISSTDALVRKVTGHSTTLLRPPYGAYNATVASAAGLPMIMWDVDTRDWETLSAPRTIQHVKAHAADGTIILMHDLHLSTVVAAETIIPWLRNQGYQMVTISEMAKYKKKNLRNGEVYRNFAV